MCEAPSPSKRALDPKSLRRDLKFLSTSGHERDRSLGDFPLQRSNLSTDCVQLCSRNKRSCFGSISCRMACLLPKDQHLYVVQTRPVGASDRQGVPKPARCSCINKTTRQPGRLLSPSHPSNYTFSHKVYYMQGARLPGIYAFHTAPDWARHESFFPKGPRHPCRRRSWIGETPGFERPRHVFVSRFVRRRHRHVRRVLLGGRRRQFKPLSDEVVAE